MSKIDFSTIFGKAINTRNDASNNLSMFFDKNIFELTPGPDPDPYADYKTILSSVSCMLNTYVALSKLDPSYHDVDSTSSINFIPGTFVTNRLRQFGIYEGFDLAELASAIESAFDINNLVMINIMFGNDIFGGIEFIDLGNPHMKIKPNINYIENAYTIVNIDMMLELYSQEVIDLLVEMKKIHVYDIWGIIHMNFELVDFIKQNYKKEHGISQDSDLTIDDWNNIFDEVDEFMGNDYYSVKFTDVSWDETAMDVVKLKEYYEARKTAASEDKLILYPSSDNLYFPYMLPVYNRFYNSWSDNALIPVSELLDFFDELKDFIIEIGITPPEGRFGEQLKEQLEKYHINKDTSFIIPHNLDSLLMSIEGDGVGIPSVVMSLVDIMNPECKTNAKITNDDYEDSDDEMSSSDMFYNVFDIIIEAFHYDVMWFPWIDVNILENEQFITERLRIERLIKDIEIKDILK